MGDKTLTVSEEYLKQERIKHFCYGALFGLGVATLAHFISQRQSQSDAAAIITAMIKASKEKA